MTWQEFWQSTLARLRTLFGARAPARRSPPSLPSEAAASSGRQPSHAPAQPRPAARPQTPVREKPNQPVPVAPASRPPEPTEAPEEIQETIQETIQEEAQQAEVQEWAQPRAASPAPAEDQPPAAPAPASPEPDSIAQEAVAQEDEQDIAGDPPPAPSLTLPPEEPAKPGEPVALTTLLESLLFVAGEPVAPADLARALSLPEAEIEEGLLHLANQYRAGGRGLRLQSFKGKVQLVTAPAAANYIEAFLNLETTTRLSTPALETLAVIAYRQPVTRAQIEAIRGVDCSGVLRSLTQRGLIAEVGRLEAAGRPILYGVTDLFMQHFGLEDLAELPPLEESEADRLRSATMLAEDEPDNH